MFVGHEQRIEAYPPFRSADRPVQDRAAPTGNALLYNSVGFVYRPEFRQLVLLDRNPETGEEVSQVPSEFNLRLYAAASETTHRASTASLDVKA